MVDTEHFAVYIIMTTDLTINRRYYEAMIRAFLGSLKIPLINERQRTASCLFFSNGINRFMSSIRQRFN